LPLVTALVSVTNATANKNAFANVIAKNVIAKNVNAKKNVLVNVIVAKTANANVTKNVLAIAAKNQQKQNANAVAINN